MKFQNWRELTPARRHRSRHLSVGMSIHWRWLGGARDFFGRGDAQYLLNSRDAHAHQSPAVFRKGPHTCAPGGVADGVAGGMLENELANLVVAIHPFENGVAAQKTRHPALAATDRAINDRIVRDANLLLEGLGGRSVIRRLAGFAED